MIFLWAHSVPLMFQMLDTKVCAYTMRSFFRLDSAWESIRYINGFFGYYIMLTLKSMAEYGQWLERISL